MNRWLVVRVLARGGEWSARGTGFSTVSVYPCQFESEAERACLDRSAAQTNEVVPPVSVRMATMVEAPDGMAAFEVGERQVVEALDLMRVTGFRYLRHQLLRCGYLRDLRTGALVPLAPEWQPFSGGMITQPFEYEPMRLGARLLHFKHLELCQRLIRSAHWTRRASLEEDPLIRVVNHWFALDAIWGTGGGAIDGYVAWGVGFPPKKGRHLLDPQWRAQLESDPTWLIWERRVRDAIERCRAVRNDVVHHAHRRVDVTQREVLWLDAVAFAAALSSESLVVTALQRGLGVQSELVANVGQLFAEVHRSAADLVAGRVRELKDAHTKAARWA